MRAWIILVGWEFLIIIAKSAHNKRKTEMAVPKFSTLDGAKSGLFYEHKTYGLRKYEGLACIFLFCTCMYQKLSSLFCGLAWEEGQIVEVQYEVLPHCKKQPGIAIGRVCEKCDGNCVICDSTVRPCTLVRVCDECNYGSFHGRCVVCGGVGISDAYYCKECTCLEKDRDGCPKIINLGSAQMDLFYERKKYGFKKR